MLAREEFITKLPTEVTIEGDFFHNKVFVDGRTLNLKKSLKVRNHSPTGFNWGYGGSGPAQFALALLLLYVGPETAQAYYQDIKFGWIAGLPRSDFIKTVNLQVIALEILNKRYGQG